MDRALKIELKGNGRWGGRGVKFASFGVGVGAGRRAATIWRFRTGLAGFAGHRGRRQGREPGETGLCHEGLSLCGVS